MDGLHQTHTGSDAAFHELQHVRLRDDFVGPDGCIAAGTLGTILQIFDGGRAYQVEFQSPYDTPETVPEHMIVAERAPEP